MRLCVAGSGTGGLEALLAARAQLRDGAELVLVAPEPEFRYRPMSHGSLFRPAPERSLAVADLVAEVRAEWVLDRVDAIYEPRRTLLTRAGDTVEYDFLVLAVGARPEPSLRQGHVWIRGGDPSFLDQIIFALRGGEAQAAAIVIPPGARWPIPAYELALVLAWSATRATVTLLSAEQAPLDMLGSAASGLVAEELDAAGVELLTGLEVTDAIYEDAALPHRPRLRIGAAGVREFDALISLPTVRGPFLAGTPTDAAGFIEVDERLKLCGSDRAWAVGRCIAAALEHDGLGARQADAAVGAIAQAGGAGPRSGSAPRSGAAPAGPRSGSAPVPPIPAVTGMLLSNQREAWLAENPPGTREPSTRCLWWPPGRAVGPMLAQRIAAWDPTVEPHLLGQPRGVPVQVPVALQCSEKPFLAPYGGADAGIRLRDVENRQLMAVRREEHAAQQELRELRTRLDELATRQRQVVNELKRHGYLVGR